MQTCSLCSASSNRTCMPGTPIAGPMLPAKPILRRSSISVAPWSAATRGTRRATSWHASVGAIMIDARSLAIKQSRKFWMRWRVRLGYPIAVVFCLLATPVPRSIGIGGIVAAFGLLVRATAAGHLRKDEELATTGPYAVTRNPLYLGSAFLAAGFIIAGHSVWA